jgi:hypothetical protein
VRWIIAGAAMVLTFVLAPILGALIRRLMARPSGKDRSRTLAEPAAKFVSTMVVTAGLIVIIGVLSPDSLEPFPTKIVEFIPRLLVAILLVLVGGTFAGLASNLVGLATLKATGRPQTGLIRLTRTAMMGLISLLAVSQLGVNTTILDTLTQAVLFSTTAAVALLAVVGGRELASEVSAGRYVRRIVKPGDRIDSDACGGVVQAIHAATIELVVNDRTTVHVPHALLMKGPLQVTVPAETNSQRDSRINENQ